MQNGKTINIGDEFDDALIARLSAVLKKLDVTGMKQKEEIGGTQFVETWEFRLKGRPVKVRMETYIGIIVSGDVGAVDVILSELERAKSDQK